MRCLPSVIDCVYDEGSMLPPVVEYGWPRGRLVELQMYVVCLFLRVVNARYLEAVNCDDSTSDYGTCPKTFPPPRPQVVLRSYVKYACVSGMLYIL